MRVVLVLVGCALAGYGGWLLLSMQEAAQVGAVVVWAAAAVVAHDLVLVPAVLGLAWLVRRAGSAQLSRVTVAVLVLLGPVSLAAVPVLLHSGAETVDPATLLSRDYGLGWALLAVGTVVTSAMLAASRILSAPDRSRSARGTHPRRR